MTDPDRSAGVRHPREWIICERCLCVRPNCGCNEDQPVRAVEAPVSPPGRVEELEAALGELVRLKDGLRDASYEHAKLKAWEAARRALRGVPDEEDR